MSAANDLQTAVYLALNQNITANVPVYDDVPQRKTISDDDFPYVQIGDDTLNEWSDDLKSGFEATITIHVFSRQRGKKETKRIQGEIYALLHRQELLIGEYALTGIDFEFEDSFLDPDGLTRHGVQRFGVFFSEPYEEVFCITTEG